MASTRKTRNDQPQTTAQALGSLLKSARDIMRKVEKEKRIIEIVEKIQDLLGGRAS